MSNLRRTPWRYIVHKNDGPLVRAKKRIGRFAWHRGWIKPIQADVDQGIASSGNLTPGARARMFRNR